MENKTHKKKIKNGGSVKNSGGYGCLFTPSLKCKNTKKSTSKNKKNKKFISKLMTKKHAIKEYDTIMKFKKILKNIPNYTDYFLVDDVSLCENVKKMTKKDLIDFDKNCTALRKKNYTSDNINANLDELGFITLPYGGKQLNVFLKNNGRNIDCIKFNNSMVNLLLNGILKMNNKGLYHLDIKESNILIDNNKNKLYPKLIDWGLSFRYDSSVNDNLPYNITQRSIQFNAPLSIILFNDMFEKQYGDYLKKENKINLDTFILNFVYFFLETVNMGHIKYLKEIFKMLFYYDKTGDVSKKQYVEHMFNDVLVLYIKEILLKYTRDGVFCDKEYFKEVFVYNLDIYGFIMSYIYFLEKLYKNYKKLNKKGIELYDKIKFIYLYFLFNKSTEKINVEYLILKLFELNNYFIVFNDKKIHNIDSLVTDTVYD